MNNHHVKSVSIDPNDTNKNIIVYKDHNGEDVVDKSFDYVVISFPIFNREQNPNDDFILDLESRSGLNRLRMKQVNTYAIDGRVRLFSGGLEQNTRIEMFDTDPNYPFRSIAVQLPVDYSSKRDSSLYVKEPNKLYKVFSDKVCDEKDLGTLFESDYTIVKYMPWLAYPKYEENPIEKTIPSVILDDPNRSRIYYTNALEWSASCMEICSISARNVSLLIANKEKIEKKNNSSSKFFKNYEPLKVRKSSDSFHTLTKALSILTVVGFLLASFFRY